MEADTEAHGHDDPHRDTVASTHREALTAPRGGGLCSHPSERGMVLDALADAVPPRRPPPAVVTLQDDALGAGYDIDLVRPVEPLMGPVYVSGRTLLALQALVR